MKISLSVKNIFLPLAIIAGLIIIAQSFDIQGYLSTGDHGRDLYAFERTLHGDMAYQDYWWVYGPLMPFYYAIFMKCYGVNVLSVLLGKAIIKFCAGLFIFVAVGTIAHPAAALLGAVWFYLFSQDFFFTYNHIGGILCVNAIAAMLLFYVREQRLGYLWTAVGAAFILSMIKINFGVAGLIAIAATAFITDRSSHTPGLPSRSTLYRAVLLYIPVVIAAAYLFFLRGLPLYELRQCMPYANADQPYNTLPWIALASYWTLFVQKLFTSRLDFFFGAIVITSIIRIAYLAFHKRLTTKEDKQHLIALAVMGIYFVLNFHEYLKSGVWYRSLWAQPIEFIFFFTAISLAIRQNSRTLRVIVWGLIALLIYSGWRAQSAVIAQIHASGQYMTDDKVKAYVNNNTSWINTVETTTAFLKENLKPDEQFFALPYDAIYYYLTGRKSPTQLLIFFEHINIPPEQERAIIADLETKKINWVVASSRMNAREAGLGRLGITYCPLIGKYLQDNFSIVTQIGDWKNEPGWGWNHGTMILKRK
ncbi:MAG: hypothetical protein HQL17_00585 [Candidatus Omnitrophica bacterium]|nr:hypothetical protein [Candidatus Omnitrophota bacterium]